MNAYGIVALGLLFIFAVFAFDLVPAIQAMVHAMVTAMQRLAQIPSIDTSQTDSPALMQFAVRGLYIIAALGLVRLLLWRRTDSDD